MRHPLEEWLPNDTPWARLSTATAALEHQCTIRNLPTTGHSKDLVQRLSAYSQAEMNTSGTKRLHPWLTEPVNRMSYQKNGLFILRFVLDCPRPYLWQRALVPSELRTIYQHSHASRALSPENSETGGDFCISCFRDVGTGREVLSSCMGCTRVMHYRCRVRAGLVRIPLREGMCWICYEDIKWNTEKFCWKNRGSPAAPRITPPAPARTYPAAEATTELIQRKELKDDVSKTLSSSSNKDSKKRQLSNTQSTNQRFPSILSSKPPSSSTSPALKSTVNQVVPYLVDGLRQGHRKSKIITLKLSKKGAALSTSSPNNEPTPLPGNPALIWQETQNTREQQQQENEGHQAALPNLSSAPDHILSAGNPGGDNMEQSEVAPAPNAAIVPAEDSTFPRASSSAAETFACTATTATSQYDQAGATSITARDTPVEGSVSQPPQVSVTSASTTESADATGAQDTTSITTENPTSASAPVPTDHSTSGPTHAHSGTQITIDHTKALELVQECSRLAKKYTQIRKKSEREAKRMEKKHRRELEKTKRKSKKEVKRLEKKIESLEKEVLKALAGPEAM
ncbi:hypothetical protein GE21DRAFT_6553 [Neurospora crassa]|uniref:Uncharacterized protein n=1 Tax=Neurospora crassa (strain ATCC 24698 / 74-OR23-1A / CBS 708.71 / DSM 1257 / FGSC 987) TaxID=367110 RepID=Q7S8Y0_NEUCR|nr:hypothetical protein NCU08835 [Neurospora crassa OR74A]EAA32810.1 hypothetical protein NCU08835 [Neurospora crassa OR74A]KHE79776.1 hypothetical protein GE21DRAFT_6553 [Neurospora crassa]|eukprot:XP_962046.1 hypothetical protein NCU08835 [Neurospora crassa OR74A]